MRIALKFEPCIWVVIGNKGITASADGVACSRVGSQSEVQCWARRQTIADIGAVVDRGCENLL